MEHLEGRQSVFAALTVGQRRFKEILIHRGTHEETVRDILDLAARRQTPIRYAERQELDALAHGASHGGVLAICSAKPRETFAQLIERLNALKEPPLLLLLEGVEDARNLGFTLRSAEALGVHAVLIKKHLWDLDPIEIARPASGAYERLPLVQVDSVDPLAQLRRRGVRLYGCLAAAKRTMHQRDFTGPTLLAVGGEKRGLSGALRSICDGFVSIPTQSQIGSLSLSHAACILLAEAMRQRMENAATAESTIEPTDDDSADLSPLPPDLGELSRTGEGEGEGER